ncbi:hypothetical protein GCM10010420_05620 [Streptomyces glaucosporus]|uniref:Secreted protein n=1 Tax=Streptomyces glaucosporus TaxID=284044 RepID=A0ABN3HQU1_9ACTN
MNYAKKVLTTLALAAVAVVGVGTGPALADNHISSPSPSQPLGG